MNISAPFVRRPVATTLLAAGILLLGLLALSHLPIASLPNVERPTIIVEAGLPGASPDTIATSLAQPLERTIGTISGIAEMTSYSTRGGTEIFVQFDLSKSIDAAAGEVLAAINAAAPNLPKDLPRPPTYFKANPSSSVAVLALTSDTIRASELYELADSVVSAKLGALPGVAQVSVSGGERGAVRIRASARRLANMKVSLEELRQTIYGATRNMPKGTLASGDQSWTIVANDQLLTAADWQDVVVTMRNGAPIRLADVAEISDSVQDERAAGWFNTERSVIVFVRKQPDANVVETVNAVKAALPDLGKWLPPAVKIHTLYDRTTLIRASVAEVGFAIEVAIALIVVVIALFLRRLGATIVPVLSIPAALAATLAGMDWLGYSLDNLSLMALAIAVGFVVDDAVIVVEYVVRLVDEGTTPREAALAAARQMGFTIVAISATLVAALVPILFMPDVVGRYFREFGMTLALAIVASALVSLTLVPMLCSHLIRRGGIARPEKPPGLFGRTYETSLAWCLRHPAPVLLALIFAMAGSAWSYIALPKGFMPTQDTGILAVHTITNPNISYPAMEQLQRRVAEAILQEPSVAALSSWIGGSGNTMSNGNLFVGLKPLDERPGVEAIVASLRQRLSGIPNIRTFFTPVQDLNLGGQGSSSRYDYTLVGPDLERLWTAAEAMRRRMLTLPQITDVISSAERSGLEAGLTIDRRRAALFGVTPFAIDNTLYDAFGQRLVGMIYRPTNYSRVVLEVNPSDATNPTALRQIYVPGAGTERPQVPLAEMMRPTRAHAPMWIRHADQFPAIRLSFDTRPGVAIADAMAAIRAAETELHLPDEIRASFRGEAGEAGKSNARQLLLFLGAVFAIYVVLGMLYESFAHPVTILSTLPSAVLGGLLALIVTGTQLTLVASIACILLVGMVMKNAILMVDFALDTQRRLSLPARDAILAAARARARPILMTTLVAALSAVPLALGTGPGHELRQPLGIASIGGLLVAQFLTLYTTPVLYVVIDKLAGKRRCIDSSSRAAAGGLSSQQAASAAS